MKRKKTAPGAPGSRSAWTTGAKEGIGRSVGAGSDVCFTLSNGVVNEVYFPREDSACIRNITFVVSNGKDFISSERWDAIHTTAMLEDGIPAYRIQNACREHRYQIEKEIISDPIRQTVLQQVRFHSDDASLQLNVTVVPRIANHGEEQEAFVEDYNGLQMLFANDHGIFVAVCASVPFIRPSVGYLDTSDGWTDLKKHGELTWEYDHARKGNVAMAARLDLPKTNEFVLVTGFGFSRDEAAHSVVSSMMSGFEQVKRQYMDQWREWHRALWEGRDDGRTGSLLRNSAAWLHMSEARRFPGAIIASLSIPWGSVREDKALGGYHLVWGRDLVFASGGFAALGDRDSVLRILNYLIATQKEDGSWYQNTWVDGKPYWVGIQLDQVAMPILLMRFCQEKQLLSEDQFDRYFGRIRKSLRFLMQTGPYSAQDRWEEVSGITTFSLATQVAALVAGGAMAAASGDHAFADECYRHADALYERVDELTYVQGGPLAEQYGVDGYYIRVNPELKPVSKTRNDKSGVPRPENKKKQLKVDECVSVDALALVRFGLRAPDDPRMLNTVKVIDAMLMCETARGTAWYRYNGDVYGEDQQGAAYQDGTAGTGRPWPLLTGERAHYELALGNAERAEELRRHFENFAQHGFLPEQVWDASDVPKKGLKNGYPTGAASPLTWAHAEYVKLCYSLSQGSVFDLPREVADRYLKARNTD